MSRPDNVLTGLMADSTLDFIKQSIAAKTATFTLVSTVATALSTSQNTL